MAWLGAAYLAQSLTYRPQLEALAGTYYRGMQMLAIAVAAVPRGS